MPKSIFRKYSNQVKKSTTILVSGFCLHYTFVLASGQFTINKISQIKNMGRIVYVVVFPVFLGMGLVLSIASSTKAEKQVSSQDINENTQVLEKIQEYNPLKQNPLKSEPVNNSNQKSTTIVKGINDGILGQIDEYNQLNQPSEISFPLERINSVNQLSDVLLTDWAYSALQGLAERYGCLLASPYATFGGNRVISRYEFAANLNECLQVIQGLIEEFDEGYISQEELTPQKKVAGFLMVLIVLMLS